MMFDALAVFGAVIGTLAALLSIVLGVIRLSEFRLQGKKAVEISYYSTDSATSTSRYFSIELLVQLFNAAHRPNRAGRLFLTNGAVELDARQPGDRAGEPVVGFQRPLDPLETASFPVQFVITGRVRRSFASQPDKLRMVVVDAHGRSHSVGIEFLGRTLAREL